MKESGSRKNPLLMGAALWLAFVSASFPAGVLAADKMSLKNAVLSLEETDVPGVKKYTMEADLKATPAQVCGVVCDYYNMNTFMPKEFTSTVVKEESNRITLDVTLDLPWPFRDLKSLLLVEFDKEAGNAKWRLIGGNIERNDGTIHVVKRGAFSHMKQVTYLDIGRYYPDWFIRIYTRSLTHKIMRAIRDQVQVRAGAYEETGQAPPVSGVAAE